jgi:hypothetical protein
MKSIFKTKNEKEAKRIVKSLDMALFIWRLRNNVRRQYEDADFECEKAFGLINDSINDLLYEYSIVIDDLIE